MTVKQRCPTVIFLLEEKKMVEKIKNGITEMVFIIDRSGSLAGMEEDTVGGFNSMIEKQKKGLSRLYLL